ncbi:M48 family metallopeptidase [Sphingomonas sp. NFR15]|uniref:M48 family metallopeptidase n=1 Tax=Sphingomonas sp. NFR15 TaxID=1566282 RepID=UPI0008804600|nr:M48 family metallopeptidase [Sphingomonas sp. NFR15]SDA36698.1 Peptidase family M48 [Sphingomonas sp. NFR15]
MRVWHYDGVSALRRAPELVAEGDAFVLVERDRSEGPYRFADLVARDTVDGDAIYGLKGSSGWRIGFPGGVPADLSALLPSPTRYGGFIDRIGLWPAAALCAMLATIAVAAFLMTPALVARAVPRSVERKLGDMMAGDFGDRACAGPNGPQALAALVARIDPGDPDARVSVVNLPIVNAVTLPGGRIVLFDGLIKAAASPDEVAGVIAHELGHVRHRDVLESLLRQLGLSVLLGGLDGHVGGYTNALLASAYSRDAEARADGYAIDALAQAHISPLPTARFFKRLAAGEDGGGIGRLTAYLSTHPMSQDRAARFIAAAKQHHDDRPVLNADQWGALRDICSTDPNARAPGLRF